MSRYDQAAGLPLAGLDIFVGGPIQHAILPDGFASPVRTPIATALSVAEAHGANTFSAHRVEEFGLSTASFTPSQVSVRDFRWMKKCDVFVPVLPVVDDKLVRTDGTHIELGWASALGRPIVIITDQPFSASASHLLKGLNEVGRVEVLPISEFLDDPNRLVELIIGVTHTHRIAIEASELVSTGA
ncbi:hypothetical protein CH254_04670 [Rhodococcus sp. 06-412-2C]|uniref:hypothetical protein n=1 Tax=unclassified Rhodococcus (in: high G+C Gram-positive bacteria) TaxID=192944 RepID=UPI000B9ABCB9|nr:MULTISPECIES: hypothetical protein [unclassified Rhodococcus (in: high G+C Gram-positive bacteria)]OZC92069.1 hypothetical protein CH254_04670 [Rhodococcus sp. 06-412-2C]OZC92641.1 hypothetical protein CH279_25945 [Rhodococcus sp. 06-412-2B]